MSTFDIKKFLINEGMTRVSRDRKRLLKENQDVPGEVDSDTKQLLDTLVQKGIGYIVHSPKEIIENVFGQIDEKTIIDRGGFVEVYGDSSQWPDEILDGNYEDYDYDGGVYLGDSEDGIPGADELPQGTFVLWDIRDVEKICEESGVEYPLEVFDWIGNYLVICADDYDSAVVVLTRM